MPSLSHRSFIIKHRCNPWYMNQGAVSVWSGSTDPSWNAEKPPTIWDLRTADRLSPHHDNQFSAFSTKVLIWSRPGHNRSSSPFTTLADIAERRVASTGAGQPNYWPKTWFGSNAYHAKFRVPNLYIKSVRTSLPYCGVISSPWRILNVQKSTDVADKQIKIKWSKRRKPQKLGRKSFLL